MNQHSPRPIDNIRLLSGIDPDGIGRILQVDDQGRLVTVLASGLGALLQRFQWQYTGNLSIGTAKIGRIYNVTGVTLSFMKVHLAVNTAPTGASIIVDINKNGVSIFNSADRPQISALLHSGESSTFTTATIANGEYLTFDVDQVGSTIPGADLIAQVLLG
jgi:hypothetical protein